MELETVRNLIAIKENWDTKRILKTEKEYLSFLELASKQENIKTPNQDVDIFWHWHILHTKKYREDCTSIFGKIIEHYPCYDYNNLSGCGAQKPPIKSY